MAEVRSGTDDRRDERRPVKRRPKWICTGVLILVCLARAVLCDDVDGLRRRAEGGDVEAQWQLALAYYNGRGVAPDNGEALRWLREAAEQGHGDAQHHLGFVYARGLLGLSRDDSEAVKWWRKAAEQGHEWGQNNLGRMYEAGRAVPRDLVQAHMWFSLAAMQGNDEAIKNRDRIAAVMRSAQIAEATRLADEWRASHSPR